MVDSLYNQRLRLPPLTGDDALNLWLREVYDEINKLPPTSVFSFSSPNSNETAQRGTLAVSLNPGDISPYFKESGDTNIGWVQLNKVAYAGILVDDNSTPMTSIASPTTVDFNIGSGTTADMPYSAATSSVANSLITIQSAGDYMTYFGSSFSCSVANSEWNVHVYKNGTATTLGAHRKIGTASDVGNMSCSGVLAFAAGDVVSSWISRIGSASAANVGFNDAQLYVVRVD